MHSTALVRYIRRMRTWPLLLALGACANPSKLDTTGGSPSEGACDELWDLAPAGTEVGIVASPRGLDLFFAAVRTADQLGKQPDFAAIAPDFSAITGGLFGKPDGAPADAGLSPTTGFAFFVTDHGSLAVLPVYDRAKFAASKHAAQGSGGDDLIGPTHCKPFHDRYVCASSPELFDKLGTGSLRGKVKLAGARGDVELYARAVPLFGGPPAEGAAAIQLAPGAITVHALWAGTPAGALGKNIGVIAPKIDAHAASGFASVNTSTFLEHDVAPLPIAGDVTLDRLVTSLAGPVSTVVPAGSLDLQTHVPLADPAPATTALAHCADLGNWIDLAPVQPKDACRFRLQHANPFELDAWVDDAAKELRFGAHRGAPEPGFGGMLTDVGRELADGSWTAVVWGRGSMLSSPDASGSDAVPADEGAVLMHAIALVNELGLGLRVDAKGVAFVGTLRTIWANPPELAEQLAAIRTQAIASGAAMGPALALAASHPGTPFAKDFAAGQGGMVLPGVVLGIAAAVVVPMLRDMLVGDDAEAPADAPSAPPSPLAP